MPNSALYILGMAKRRNKKVYVNEGLNEDMELPIIDLTAISNATDNFQAKTSLEKVDLDLRTCV